MCVPLCDRRVKLAVGRLNGCLQTVMGDESELHKRCRYPDAGRDPRLPQRPRACNVTGTVRQAETRKPSMNTASTRLKAGPLPAP